MLSPDKPIISLADVSMRYDRRMILADVNLELHRGDFMAVTGPNGGGKTTLLRIVLGLLQPTSGSVSYDFPPLPGRASIGYLPQKNSIDNRFPITVAEVVELGLIGHKDLTRDERRVRVAAMLEMIRLADHARQPIGNVSGGQLQRALFGRAVIDRPQVLVLDEPLSYLDRRSEEMLYDILDRLRADTTIMVVSHDMTRLDNIASRHIEVEGTVSVVR